MKYSVYSRVDESGAVTMCEIGLLKAETSKLNEAIRIAERIPGGYVKREDGAVLEDLTFSSWIVETDNGYKLERIN